MENDRAREIVEHFNKKPSLAIIWLSGIEDERSIPEIKKIWGYGDSRIFSQPVYRGKNADTDKNYLELLEDLGAIERERGSQNKNIIYSKTGWLAELVSDEISEYDFESQDQEEIQNFFESEAFRSLFQIDSVTTQVETNTEDSDEEKLWKRELSWLNILKSRLKAIRICKTIKQIGEPAETILIKKPRILYGNYVGERQGVSLHGMYDKVKDKEIPSILKPLYTEEDLIQKYTEDLEVIKENWNSAWEEIMDRIEK